MVAPIAVTHLYPSLTADADGAASVVRSLIREQLKLSCTVHFGCHRVDSVHELKQLRVTWWDVLRSAYRWAERIVASKLRIKTTQPSKIIHVHGLWDAKVLLLSVFEKREGDVCVHSTHGMMSSYSFNHKKLKKLIFHLFIQSKIIKNYDVHIANSKYELDDLQLDLPSSSLISIPNGVDQVPSSFCLSPHRSNILYFGRIHPKKNVHLLIEGFGLAQPFIPNFTLEIIGCGDRHYMSELEALILKNGIRNIKFKPEIEYEKRFEVFQNAVVTALPSKNENFGIVVAESLACGVPVIVSGNMPWKDVKSRECGWIVDTNPESIAKVLISMSKKTESEIVEMGRIGAQWVRDEFSWEKINYSTIKLYYDILAKKTGSGNCFDGHSAR